MPYVPPHKRAGEADAPPASDRQPLRTSSSANTSSGRRDFAGSRSNSQQNLGSADRSSESPRTTSRPSWGNDQGSNVPRSQSKTSLNVETVIPQWQPSERVLSLGQEQIDEIRQRLSVIVEVPADEPGAATPIESFIDMNLHENIVQDIKHHKYETPTPIQSQGVPLALSGRDILGCAETGSGKTASFAIPMIQHCLAQHPVRPGDGPLALVLAPTRELAQQIEKEIRAFSRSSRNVRTTIVVGGVSMGDQRSDLRGGVEVVVATPGRFIDHLQQGNTSLSRVSFIVLDEADRMLDMGFEPQIKEVMGRLPARHQTLLFSATMPTEIEALAALYLNKPVKVKIGSVSTPTANVSQSLERTTDGGKLELLVALLTEEASAALAGGAPMPLTIVFVERKTRCDEVAAALRDEGITALALHGGLEQNEREGALRDFSKGVVKVLVATDVASRGLDVKGIGHVVNMDLPKTFEDYVHRVGRTGRAGERGRATSFFTDRDSFLVAQIKGAISDLESGNKLAFATGKAARQQERQMAKEFKSNMKLGSSGIVQAGGAAVQMGDRYGFMAASATSTTASANGRADAAWDD